MCCPTGRSFFRTLWLCVFVCSTAQALTLQVPLEYQRHSYVQDQFYPFGSTHFRPHLESPEGDWELPDFVSARPVFGILSLGDSEFLYILDRSGADDTFYSRIFFDINGNRDLTDDPVLQGEVRRAGEGFYPVEFPESVDVRYRLDGEWLPYSLQFMMSCRSLDLSGEEKLVATDLPRYVNLYIRSNCSYKASFELKGKTYRLLIGDGNCNGRFTETVTVRDDLITSTTERMPLFLQGDRLYFASGDDLSSDDESVLVDSLLIEETLFDLRIDTAGKRLFLDPVAEDLVPLELSQPPEMLLALEVNE
ncbi:MAG: hypothetical protein JSU96_02630, partial [Acidobacteriota bacterium]